AWLGPLFREVDQWLELQRMDARATGRTLLRNHRADVGMERKWGPARRHASARFAGTGASAGARIVPVSSSEPGTHREWRNRPDATRHNPHERAIVGRR